MRNCRLLITAATALSALPSLAQGPPENRKGGPAPRLRIMGVVSEPATPTDPRNYAFASLDKVALGSDSLPARNRLPLATAEGVPEPLEVREEAVSLEILQRHPATHRFHVLFGPKLCTSSPTSSVFCPDKKGSGWVERYEGSHADYKGVMTFHLQEGWVFVWSNPSQAVAKSEWIIGATEGSVMALEIVDPDTQRVYFDEGTRATVACEIPGNTSGKRSTTTARQVIEVTRSGNECVFGAWTPLPDPVPKGHFLYEARNMAKAAGK